jgi:hypothetical protein
MQATLEQSMAAQAHLAIDRAAISTLLVDMGIDLAEPLAPSMILAAFDLLACVEVGRTLPPEGDFDAVLQCFHTMRHPQPEPVRRIQMDLLDMLVADGLFPLRERVRALYDRLGESCLELGH